MTSAHKNTEDRTRFDQAMKTLESQVASIGAHVTIDSTTRLAYSREIKAMARKLAIAGLACGPGAPVCVTIGAFVGGALAAFGINSLW